MVSQKAMPMTKDQIQGIDAFSTPKIAPATPMQAWQKPLDRQDSPDILPSLSLGRSSAELKAAYVNSDMSHVLLTSAKSALGGASTPSRLHSGEHKGANLLSFSMSKYEKSVDDMAAPLRNHMGPSSSHRVCAPAADSRMLSNGSFTFSHEEHIACGNVGVADESAPTLSNNSERALNAEATHIADFAVALCSPVPGEVANNAYKLYSEFFPSTSTAQNAVFLSSSMVMDAHPNPFPREMDSSTLLPPEFCGQSSKPGGAQSVYVHNNAQTENSKKRKLTTNEKEAISKGLLVPKQEPVYEELHGIQELSSHVDACSTGAINLTRKVYSNGNVSKDFSFLKSPRPESESLPKPLSSKVFKHITYMENCAEEVKPTVGLELFTLSENSSTLFAGAASCILSSKAGAWEAPAQCKSSMDGDWGKFLALSARPSAGNANTTILLPFQQRFKDLQAFLKQCDEADQKERMQGLRLLSPVARNGYAVELETRAIHLSLEEGKELKRMRLLNVLGKVSESSIEESGATPHGPKLPVPGATSCL